MDTQIASQLAIKLMNEHGLLANWKFVWMNGRNCFGSCNYRTHVIALSEPLTLLNSEEQVKDTILHEIAHALAGKTAHHSQSWKDVCNQIGARPERLYRDNVVQPKARYIATCKNCGEQTEYNVKRRISCGKCSPRFNKKYLLKFKRQDGD